MTENRIRELRRSHNMSQEALWDYNQHHPAGGKQDGKDTCAIPTDLLSAWQGILNVTTDYILGLSDIKRI